jgi:hypothetical protein
MTVTSPMTSTIRISCFRRFPTRRSVKHDQFKRRARLWLLFAFTRGRALDSPRKGAGALASAGKPTRL